MESRVEKAVQTFESGFGCAQSVFPHMRICSGWTGRQL